MIQKCVAALVWPIFCVAIPCLGQSPTNTQQQVEAHLHEAHRLLNENKPAEAIPEFKAVVSLDPSNADAHGNLGVLLFFQGNYTAAIPELREALRLKPDLPKIQALLGMGERRSGESGAARADLEAAFPQLQERKIRIESGLELIEIYTASEEMDKASAMVGTLRALDPENQEVQYAAYRVHSDMAREAILSLSLLAPKSALMYQAAAHEAARRGDTAGAIQDYRQAIKLSPQLPGIHFELAEMLNSLAATSALHAEAQSQYEIALAQNPFDEKADIKLAEIATHNNDEKKAYELYTRAVQLQPDDPEANYELARILLSMNQPERAEKLLEHAVQLDPTSAAIHFRLSTVYHRLGRNADADREAKEYQKYKVLKEKLRDTWKDLHFDPEKPDMYDSDHEK
jgi:predicted Zn-dependent protease